MLLSRRTGHDLHAYRLRAPGRNDSELRPVAAGSSGFACDAEAVCRSCGGDSSEQIHLASERRCSLCERGVSSRRLPQFLGAPNFGASPLPESSQKDFENSTTDKAKVIAQLNQSFDYVRSALEKRSNEQLERIVKEFGPEASEGDVVFLIVSDAHEHLGQAVAHARMNGIVPPWTAARMKN
jgi:hypothetical protein